MGKVIHFISEPSMYLKKKEKLCNSNYTGCSKMHQGDGLMQRVVEERQLKDDKFSNLATFSCYDFHFFL